MDNEPKDVRLPVMVSRSEVVAIDEWRYANKVPTRAEAIRRLMELGLINAPKAKQPPSPAAPVPEPERTTREISERRSAAAQGRKLAEQGRRRAGLKTVPE